VLLGEVLRRCVDNVITPGIVMAYIMDRRLNPRSKTETGVCAWTTVATLWGRLYGALRLCPTYGMEVKCNLQDHGFSLIDRFMRKMSYSHKVRFPTPATTLEWKSAMKTLIDAGNTMAARYLLLWWTTAARPGDVLWVQRRNVSRSGAAWSVQFVQGKGVTLRGP
jgi:hypothetical protein